MAIKSKIKGKKKHTNKPTSKKYKMYKVEGDKIVDFQSGNYTQREILEMFSNESEE